MTEWSVDVTRECTVSLRDGKVSVSASPGVDPMQETRRQIDKAVEWLELLRKVEIELQRGEA